MASSAARSLKEEFKCPICLGDITNPKYIGPCMHTACCACVASLIFNISKEDVFPCPVCRKDCPVPEEGVLGLTDNFQLKAIMERCENVPGNIASSKCSACKSAASHFCKECEGIYLCSSCATKHDQNPDTSAHVLIGICKEDGKSLTKFCGGCNQAICSVCRISKHSGGGSHDVSSHSQVVEKETKGVMEEIIRTEKNLGKKERYKKNIQHIHDSVVKRIVSECGLVIKRSNSAITITKKKLDELSTRQRHLKNQIKELSEELEVVEADLCKTDSKITELTEKKDELFENLSHQGDLLSVKLKKAINQVAAEMSELNVEIDRGRAETSVKRVLDDQTVPNLVSIRENLQKMSIATGQDDDLATFTGIENKMVRFEPGDDDIEIGRLVGDFLIPEFTSVKKVADLSFPSDRPCHVVCRLKHPDDNRVVSLYRSGEPGDDTICMFDTILTDECLMKMKITKNIQQGIDMTTTAGELIVLRRTPPAISAFNSNSNTLRNIKVNLDNPLDEEKNWSIEADEKGNMFLLNDTKLLAINRDGNLITDVNVGRAWKMSFCRSRRLLYIAAHDRIIKYHWNGCMLTHISSLPHGVQDFICGDVCVGSVGDVFVSGIISANHEIRIYQVAEAEQTKEDEESGDDSSSVAHSGDGSSRDDGEEASQKFTMTRINFADNYQPIVTNLPCISVRDDTLVLGYDSKTEVFKLFS